MPRLPLQVRVRRFGRVHRTRLLVAVPLVGVAGAMVASSASERKGEPLPPLPTRTQICAAAHRNEAVLRKAEPRPSEIEIRETTRRTCLGAGDVSFVATEPSGPVPPCDLSRAATPVRRHDLAPAARGNAPLFARTPGTLPAAGRGEVAGVTLPPGAPCGRFWMSKAAVADPGALAAKLAAAFPQTGLWPVLWWRPRVPPSEDVARSEDPARADRLDAARVLAGAWRAAPGGRDGLPFPGLAHGSDDVAVEDPFAKPAHREPGDPRSPLLLLVPVHRPADVIPVLGLAPEGSLSDLELDAVLRSWEERFGATLVGMAPSGIELAVSAPPANATTAAALAREITLVTPDAYAHGDESLVAEELRAPPGQPISSRAWSLSWLGA